jgi:RNA polymerase sigma factor (sigma-70 family)
MASLGPSFDDRFAVLSAVAYRVAFRLLGNRSKAKNVAQEAVARALARTHSVSSHDAAWVARVATNLAIGRWRRRRPTVPLRDGDLSAVSDTEGRVLDRLGLVQALARLPRRQRDVIALRYLADLPERDVARMLNTSVGTVKQHTHRALRRLRVDVALFAPTGGNDAAAPR